MTDFDYDTFVISCDRNICTQEDSYDADDWKDGMAQAKVDGWISRLIDEEWQHFCSQDCYIKQFRKSFT